MSNIYTIKNNSSKHICMQLKKIFSFTLIEMLIVIVIIGVLSAALIPRIVSIQAKARDTQRKVDLRTIHNALTIYYNDKAIYPYAANPEWSWCGFNDTCNVLSYQTQPWIIWLSGYIGNLPVDPVNKQRWLAWIYGWPWITGNTVYRYGNIFRNWQTYDLSAYLENPNDLDRCWIRDYKWTHPPTSYCIADYPWVFEYSPDSNAF